MIPDMIKTAFDSSVKKVTDVRTISSAMLHSSICQKISQAATTLFHFSSYNCYSRTFFLHFEKNNNFPTKYNE